MVWTRLGELFRAWQQWHYLCRCICLVHVTITPKFAVKATAVTMANYI